MPTEIFLILCRYLGINNAHDFFLQMLSSYLKVLLYGGQIELAFSSFASLQCNWRYCLDILQEERRPLVVDYREEEKLSLPMCTNLVLIIEKPTSPKIRTTSGRGISQLTTIIQKAKFASLCVKVFQDQCDLTVPLIEPEEDKFFADDIVEEEPKVETYLNAEHIDIAKDKVNTIDFFLYIKINHIIIKPVLLTVKCLILLNIKVMNKSMKIMLNLQVRMITTTDMTMTWDMYIKTKLYLY